MTSHRPRMPRLRSDACPRVFNVVSQEYGRPQRTFKIGSLCQKEQRQRKKKVAEAETGT